MSKITKLSIKKTITTWTDDSKVKSGLTLDTIKEIAANGFDDKVTVLVDGSVAAKDLLTALKRTLAQVNVIIAGSPDNIENQYVMQMETKAAQAAVVEAKAAAKEVAVDAEGRELNRRNPNWMNLRVGHSFYAGDEIVEFLRTHQALETLPENYSSDIKGVFIHGAPDGIVSSLFTAVRNYGLDARIAAKFQNMVAFVTTNTENAQAVLAKYAAMAAANVKPESNEAHVGGKVDLSYAKFYAMSKVFSA